MPLSQASLPPGQALVREALDQAWFMHHNPETLPAADIDIVWAVSAPGTAEETAYFPEGPKNPYNGTSYNQDIIEHAASTVVEVTARRLGKTPEEVTREDILHHGPILLYNGESPTTKNTRFPNQNADFLKICEAEGFPVPPEKIAVGEISEAHTPAQVQQLAQYLMATPSLTNCRSIAVVCGLPHTVRTGRYLKKFESSFPEGVRFVALPVEQGDAVKASTLVALETRKAVAYLAIGHLAPDSVFFQEAIPGGQGRPRNLLRGGQA